MNVPTSTALYLAGDSYPRDLHVEDKARRALASRFADWIGQREVLERAGEAAFEKALGHRLAVLERVLERQPDPGNVILFGRSSGARVASLYAVGHAVRAVICLGYPFQRPGREREPDRTAHLARLRTPTLIIQGRSDPYMGPDGVTSFPLSEAVTLCFVDCNHEFRGVPELWTTIHDAIMHFCAGLDAGRQGRGPKSSVAPAGEGRP